MIDAERINSQLSLSHEKAIASVDPRGGGSTIDEEKINSQLSLLHEKATASVDPGWGELMPPKLSVRSTGWPLVEVYNY